MKQKQKWALQKWNLCSGVRMVYLRGGRHTEELVYLTRWAKIWLSEWKKKRLHLHKLHVYKLCWFGFFHLLGLSYLSRWQGEALLVVWVRVEIHWLGKISPPLCYWLGCLRRSSDLCCISVCWALAGAVSWRGAAALPCQARLEGSYLLPSASITALVISPHMWVLHSSACFPADTKILIIML